MPSICPAIPRGITNYMTSCELNTALKVDSNSKTEGEYRTKLQNQPQMFDTASRKYTDFQAFWPVTPCPPFTSE